MVQAREAGDSRLEICSMPAPMQTTIWALSPASRAISWMLIWILGLAPQALCLRPLSRAQTNLIESRKNL